MFNKRYIVLRQFDKERGTLLLPAFEPDMAAVQLHDLLGNE